LKSTILKRGSHLRVSGNTVEVRGLILGRFLRREGTHLWESIKKGVTAGCPNFPLHTQEVTGSNPVAPTIAPYLF